MRYDKEEWRDIPGYENIYRASTHGRIKSYGRYIGCVGGNKRFLKGRIIRPGKNKYGYLQAVLYKNTKKKDIRVNRIILEVFFRPPKEGEECNHKDGNKQNNHIENLEWCTHLQNMQHKDNVLGKHSRGENSGNAKFSEQEARCILILLKEGNLTQKQIANRFGVSIQTISRIKCGKRWAHVNI